MQLWATPACLTHCSAAAHCDLTPPHPPTPPFFLSTTVGVPAKVIKRLDEFDEPVKQMDQVSGFILDFMI